MLSMLLWLHLSALLFRDLLKWCSRIARDFDVSKTTTGSMVFQEALDCFAACLSRMEKRLPLAEAIGAKLNITKVKVGVHLIDYYYTPRHVCDMSGVIVLTSSVCVCVCLCVTTLTAKRTDIQT